MSPVDTDLFERDQGLLRQRFGEAATHSASVQPAIERIHIPSLPEIMRITSTRDDNGEVVWGIPIGRVSRLWGDPSTGKTMLAYYIIAAAQAHRSERFPKGLKCMYWNIEGQFDPVHAASFGIDLDSLELSHLTLIEDIAGAMDLALGSCHLHVIDSASFATPMGEIVGPKGSKRPEYDVYSQQGLHARAWKFAINRIHHRMDKLENAIIVIDHAVQDPSTKVEHALSGRRMEFRADLGIHLRRGAHLYYNKNGILDTWDKIKDAAGTDPRGMKQADGVEVKVKINKSRVCRPFRTGTMRLDLNTMRFDTNFELADFAIYYDENGSLSSKSKNQPIIPKTTNGYYTVPGYDKAVHGFDALHACVSSDEFLQQRIKNAMLAAA